MNRRLLPAVLLLLAPAPAHAIPITGHAVGTITENHSGPPNSTARIFAVGSTFLVSFTYDLEPNPNVLIGIDILGPDEFELSTQAPFAFGAMAEVQASEVGDRLRIDFSRGGPQIVAMRLILDDHGVGSFLYSRDMGSPHEGFLATLVRTSAPVPEPPTALLAIVGGILAAARMARRA